MMPKTKLRKLDPPMKDVTIRVPSEIANEFNNLIKHRQWLMSIEQNREVSKSGVRSEIFSTMVLNERIKDVGEARVNASIINYFETQETIKKLNEHTQNQLEQDSLS